MHFIGHNDEMQLGYRFYDTQKKTLVLSCDIMFLWKSIASNSKNNARRKTCINQPKYNLTFTSKDQLVST